MFAQTIELSTIDKANRFHRAITKIPCDIDLTTQNRHYVVDAKSIMGIFSLDLTKPVILKAYTEDEEVVEAIKKILEDISYA